MKSCTPKALSSQAIRERRKELALVDASRLGDCTKVRLLLEKGISADSLGSFGWTALQEAASGGHIDVVRLLCSYGCDLDSLAAAGETALHKSATNGDVNTMEALLSAGCGVNVVNCGGHSPLHVAAYHGHIEATKLLLEHNANVRLNDRWKQTPLHRAAGKIRNFCISLLEVFLAYSSFRAPYTTLFSLAPSSPLNSFWVSSVMFEFLFPVLIRPVLRKQLDRSQN